MTLSPGLDGRGAEFFVEPVAIHDLKVDFVSMLCEQCGVGWQARSDTVQRVLIRTGTDRKREVEEAAWVVCWIFQLIGVGQCCERCFGPSRIAVEEGTDDVRRVTLQASQGGPAGEVV